MRVASEHLRAMTNPGGDKTIDDLLKVVDELEKGQSEDLVGQRDPGPEDQEPDAGGKNGARRTTGSETFETRTP